MFPSWALIALFFVSCVGAQIKGNVTPEALARGWGKDINWLSNYEEGLSEVVNGKKPMMVIHHKEDCMFSQALKKEFVADKTIQKMAEEDFIMLNVVEDTGDKNMAPDGYYVPRILFVDPSLTVRDDITGRYSNHRYTYEPTDMKLLAANMKKAKKLLHSEL
ncbi:anterior gradient 1 [Thalassophryne amazonica]|uniref:anterior gradient 1 n=1 Tax=Thalassophryne amazonica TaxID=390379 RepID=UPI0014723FE0|nr:anterior gradient 1 [Thalassophryne amazonica]